MKRLLAIAGIVLATVACSTRNVDQRFFEEVGSLSKEEIMARGEKAAEKKDWEEARKFYSFLADSFPNDPLGRRAALKVADTFFVRKDVESLTEAQLRYRDFVNRFPSDPNRAYALLMLGKTSFLQHRGPLRDLTPVREAAASFRQVVELYPNAEEIEEARTLLAQSLETLAMHELEVGRFYARNGAWEGARRRLEELIAAYPETDAAKQAIPLLREVEEKSGDSPPTSGSNGAVPPHAD